jgi:tetratricopeptide (TPR) repeat protein
MLHEQTPIRAAFELLTVALEDIREFQKSGDRKSLRSASSSLAQALEKDPDYLGAVFYSGIVSDLEGKPAEAPEFFKRVIDSKLSAAVTAEATYNIGVANYHQYSQDKVRNAAAYFRDVIATAEDASLKLLARANLAQAHAMSMLPSFSQLQSLDEGKSVTDVYPDLPNAYEEAGKEARICLTNLRLHAEFPQGKRRSIEAMAQNALGMREMYAGDLMDTDQSRRVERAHLAMSLFESAMTGMAKDWANTCDLASANMRLAMWEPDANKRKLHYQAAEDLLMKVSAELYPDYGFAFYEMGRLRRTNGFFEESLELYNRALNIPQAERAVGNPRLEREIKLARAKSTKFP